MTQPLALFNIEAAMPMKYDLAPGADHDERARRYYAESPALAPFSRVPVSFEVARSFGINSWARADKRALADSTSHSSGVTEAGTSAPL